MAPDPETPEVTAPTRRRRFRPLRLLAKTVMWLVIVVVALLLIVFALLQTEFGRELVRDVALDALNGGIRGRLEVDRLGGTLPFDVALEGVRIFDPDGELALGVEKVTADVHPFDLLDQTVHLSDIVITQPDVRVLDDAGQVRLARAFEPRVPTPPDPNAPIWIVRLESVALEHGVIDAITGSSNLRLEDTSLDVSLYLGEKGLAWRDLVLSTRPSAPLPPEVVVRADGELDGPDLVLSRFELEASPHRVVLDGRVRLSDLSRAEAHLSAVEVDLDALPAAIGPLPFGGTVELTGDASIADGHLDGTLAAATPLGGVEVQLGMETLAVPIAWEGTVRFTALRPGILDPSLPQTFEADGAITVAGAGDPASPAQLHAEGELIERAPSPGGRLGIAIDRLPSGFNPTAGSGLYGFNVSAEELEIDPWLHSFGQPELSARLAQLGASGQVILTRGSAPQIIAGADYDLSVDGRVSGVPEALRADLVFGSADVQWGGDGLPVGQLALTLSDAWFGAKGAAFASVNATLGRDDRARTTFEGVVTAQEVAIDRDVAVDRAIVPFDLVARDLEGVPEGPISVDASGVAVAGQRLGRLSGRFDVRRASGGVRVAGRFDAAGVATSAGAGAEQVVGTVDSWIGASGQLEGDAEVTLTSAAAAGARAARLHATARIDARRGMGSGMTLTGAYDAGGIALGGLSVGASDGEYAVSLAPADGPTGSVQARVKDLRVAGCAGERSCLVDAVKADVQLQPNGRVAWDVRAGAGGLETTLLGVAALPLGGRALQVDLDRFSVTHVTDDGGRTDLLVADRLRYLGSGLIRVGELRLVGPDGDSGWFRAQGTVDAAAGAIDLLVDARGIDLAAWVKDYPRLAALVLAPKRDGEGGPDGFGLTLPDVAGRADIGGYVRGTFAAPELRLAVTLTEGRLDDLRGLRLGTVLDWHGDRLSADVGGSWHEGARFTVRGRVPMTLSLAPSPAVTADPDGAFSLEIDAKDEDLTATQRFLAGVGASGRLQGKPMAGKASLALKSKGSFRHPEVELHASGVPLTLGRFDGQTALAVISKEGRTELTLKLDGAERQHDPKAEPGDGQSPWPERKPLVDLDAVLPFDIAEVISSGEPLTLVRQRLRDAAPETCRVDAQIGRMTLAETPVEPFLRDDAARAMEIVAQLHVAGPLSRLDVSGSRIEVANAGFAQGGLVLYLKSDRGTLSALLSTSARDERILRGSLVVPDAGLLLAEPERIPELLKNPRFKLTLFSDDMTSAELWDFNQSLGEIAAGFLPDARAMVHVNAHGAKKGPEANVLVRLRNGRRSARRGDDLDRNVADDLRVIVSVRPEKTSVVLRITQDAKDVNGASKDRPEDLTAARPVNGDAEAGDAPPECRVTSIGDAPYAMMVEGAVPLGTRALLDGGLPELGELPISVQIASCGLQLGRVVRAMGATFGPSRGRLDGRVKMTGTIAAPTFAGRLTAAFKQLDVDVIGFHRDRMELGITFDEHRIALVPIHLEGKPSSGAKGAKGDAAESYLTLSMGAEIKRLDATGIRLDGALEMRDFPLVDTRDAKARVAADVAVSGTVAQPDVSGHVDVLSGVYQREFGARDVRPLGLPEDVTIVRGDPVPPATAPKARRLRTGAKLDVTLKIQEGKFVIENDMLRILPWTKDLHVQTVDGDVAITGTIFVPKEKITLYGKVFTVAPDSRVVFTGDMSTDPQLLVSATYDISEVDLSPLGLTTTADSRAKVAITGNAAAPKLTLSSDPAMDESNIINVIVFDAPVGQGDTQDSNVRSQVANLVIGLATGSLSRFVTEQLPVDTFQLDTKSGDLTESRLTVGKRLAKNLFFRYRRNIGADGETESANEFSAEYRVGPMTLLGNYGDIGEFSLEANLHVSD